MLSGGAFFIYIKGVVPNAYTTTKEVEPILLKPIVDEFNLCDEQLQDIANTFANKTNGLVIEDSNKIQNAIELNLYRGFISNNFEIDFNSSHFIDNSTSIGLDF